MGWSNGTLLFMAAAGSTGQDLWTVPVSSLGVPTGKPVPLIQTPFNDLPGRLSPDGRWIAYSSNESGTNEVYVAPTSGPSGVKWQISTAEARVSSGAVMVVNCTTATMAGSLLLMFTRKALASRRDFRSG